MISNYLFFFQRSPSPSHFFFVYIAPTSGSSPWTPPFAVRIRVITYRATTYHGGVFRWYLLTKISVVHHNTTSCVWHKPFMRPSKYALNNWTAWSTWSIVTLNNATRMSNEFISRWHLHVATNMCGTELFLFLLWLAVLRTRSTISA